MAQGGPTLGAGVRSRGRSTIVGLLSSLALTFGAIMLGGSVQSFLDAPRFMIVVGGTLAFLLITFPLRDVN